MPRVPPPTDRLRFRRYVESDVEFVRELFDDAYAERFYPEMGTTEQASRWITWNLSSYREYGFGLWVVENRETDAPVGDCGLTMQPVGHELLPEVGYHLIERERGRGFAVEAARACVRFALDVLGFTSVCSIVDPDNTASIQVAASVHDVRETFTNGAGHTRLLFTTTTRVDPRQADGRVDSSAGETPAAGTDAGS